MVGLRLWVSPGRRSIHLTIQERDRITKFSVAWSDDTAEDQHVKSLPFLSCVLYLSSQRHTVTSIFLSHAQAAEVRSTGRV